MQCAIKDCEKEARGILILRSHLPSQMVDISDARCKTHLTVEEKNKKWQPKNQGMYWFIDSDNNELTESSWTDHAVDESRRDFLGIFRTKEEATRKLALVKALCPADRFVPEDGEKYWIFEKGVTNWIWRSEDEDKEYLAQGNVHRTQKEAQAYGAILEEAAGDLIG